MYVLGYICICVYVYMNIYIYMCVCVCVCVCVWRVCRNFSHSLNCDCIAFNSLFIGGSFHLLQIHQWSLSKVFKMG